MCKLKKKCAIRSIKDKQNKLLNNKVGSEKYYFKFNKNTINF